MLWTEPFSFVRGRGSGRPPAAGPAPRRGGSCPGRRGVWGLVVAFLGVVQTSGQLLVLLAPSEEGDLPGSVWLFHTLDSEVGD